jgi:glycosyltransferase involved in cell wall biosynthesis
VKLFFVLPRLDGGGLERVMLYLLPEFRDAGIDVSLVVGQLRGELVPLIPRGIPTIEIAPSGPYRFFDGLIRAILRHRPTHILSAADDVNIMALLANRIIKNRARVVVTNHNTLSEQLSRARRAGHLKLIMARSLMRTLYPWADGVVAVSSGVADDLAQQLRLARGGIEVIFNPVVDSGFEARTMEPPPELWPHSRDPVILYAGRLVSQKRPDLLLEAFAHLLQRQAAFLAIAGTGPERSKLEAEVTNRGWQGRVKLLGFVPNVLPLMRAANVVVLTSDYEGMGNVIVEALACGTPVVSTDCPSGPAEVLEGGRWGRLVPTNDPVALGQALLDTLNDPAPIPPELLVRRASFFSARRAARSYLRILTSRDE